MLEGEEKGPTEKDVRGSEWEVWILRTGVHTEEE